MKTINKDPRKIIDPIGASFQDFIRDVSKGIIKVKEKILSSLDSCKSIDSDPQKKVSLTLAAMLTEYSERQRQEKAYLEFFKLDKFFDTLKDFQRFSVKYNLEIDQVRLIVRRMEASNLKSSVLKELDHTDIDAIIHWNSETMGEIPNLAKLNLVGYTRLSNVRTIALQVNRKACQVTDLLQELKKYSFSKEDVASLVKEDYLALFELLRIRGTINKSSVSIYNQMPAVLQRCCNAWLEKVFVSTYARPGVSVDSIGEQLKYFIEQSSKEIPKECNYALKCLNLLFLSFGVKLPDSRMIYLAAIWAVMASCMTAHVSFDIVELGAAIIAVIISLLLKLIKDELEDISLLLSTDKVKDWSDISSKSQGYLNDDIKNMIESWRNTLSILADKPLDLSNAARMLSTYCFGTSYIRYMCRGLSIHAIFDSISPYPTKYSLHNMIKLYRSDEEFEFRKSKLKNQYSSSELPLMKLAYLPYDKKGKRGDFCSKTGCGYVKYYNSLLTDALKNKIKEHVTNKLPHNAPIYSGEVIMGLLDAEDIFAEEVRRPECEVSVKNDKQIELYARLSAHVYGHFEYAKPYDCEAIEERWTNNDMHSIVYKRGCNDIICAFAGTDSIKDWGNNFAQAKGVSPQYDDALRFGGEVCRKYHNKNIVFVGHSQGGGEAAYCAAVYGKSAYTFNPAGLSSSTLSKTGVLSTTANYEIHSYVFRCDVLNIFQDICDMMGLDIFADGIRYNVTDYTPEKASFSEMHGMKGILRYFGVKENQNSVYPSKHPVREKYNRQNSSKKSVSLKKLLLEDMYEHGGRVFIRGEVIETPISVGDVIFIYRENDESYKCVVDNIMKNGYCFNSASKGETVRIITKKVTIVQKKDALSDVLMPLSQKK